MAGVMYDLHNLGWNDFQQLCLTITREILGQVVESFLDSSDGGRDGAFTGQWQPTGQENLSGPFVIQCKFTSRVNYVLKTSDLADEAEKAKKLVARGLCDSYVLMTNAGLSGSSAAKIKALFKAAGVKHIATFGSTWISQQILENKRLRMLVPRVYGLGDLSQIVDKHRGVRYPPSVLLGYKDAHEARIAREQGGQGEQFSWLERIRLRSGPIFVPDAVIDLGKLTVVCGENETGKSGLCKWLAGLSEPQFLERWVARPHTRGPDISVTCLTPFGRQEQRARVRANGQVEYWIDDTPVPLLPAPVRSLYLREYASQYCEPHDEPDDIAVIAERLGLTKGVVQNPVGVVDHSSDPGVRSLQVQEGGGRLRLYCDVEGTVPGLPFGQLSSSEQVTVMVRLAAAYANTLGRAAPTILLLDGGMVSLGAEKGQRTAEFLMRKEHRFQSLVVLLPGSPWPLPWQGWEFVRLVGEVGSVRIEQAAT